MKPTFVHTTEKESLWDSTTLMPSFSALTQDIATDVCIVGGGVAGLTTAYALCRQGLSVVLIEAGELASGMSHMTSAHLTCVPDDRFVRLEQLHGTRNARLAIQSHMAAIDRIERIVHDESIDCDFERVNGYLFRSPESADDLLSREYLAALRMGAEVRFMEMTPLTFDAGPCLCFNRQAQFHPLRYLSALSNAITQQGGRIFTNTHADQIESGPPARIRTPGGTVTAKDVVVATNTPINDLFTVHTKQTAMMTYMIGARIPRGSVHGGLYWDTADPLHYVRLQEIHYPVGDADFLIIGGEDHRVGQDPDTVTHYSRLQAWAREHFPQIEAFEFEWSGEVMQSVDGLAFIGRNPMDQKNVFIVTGDCGMGITYGTLASMILTDLIQEKDNYLADLYSPSRRNLRAAPAYAREAINTASQYADWLTSGDVNSPDEIAPDTGALLRRGMSKIAAYRDEFGTLHEMSAVCPHLNGIVHWNNAEKTWDCPCHGSRFTKLGEPMHGPANTSLSKLTPSQEPPAPHSIGMGE